MRDEFRQFLTELGTHNVSHSRRTLFDHLKGVHDLLRDWDNRTEVVVAGLFHSIYGTEYFKHQTIDDRRRVTVIIGSDAEALVHAFCVAKDRPLFESVADPKMRAELQEIEAANLVEQSSKNLKAIRKLARTKISDGARAALLQELV